MPQHHEGAKSVGHVQQITESLQIVSRPHGLDHGCYESNWLSGWELRSPIGWTPDNHLKAPYHLIYGVYGLAVRDTETHLRQHRGGYDECYARIDLHAVVVVIDNEDWVLYRKSLRNDLDLILSDLKHYL